MQLTRDDLGNFLRVCGDRALEEGRSTMGELLRIMADVADDYSHEAFWEALLEYIGRDAVLVSPSAAHYATGHGRGPYPRSRWRAELQDVVDAVVQPECNLKGFLWWLSEHPRVTKPALVEHLREVQPYSVVDWDIDEAAYIGNGLDGVSVCVGLGPAIGEAARGDFETLAWSRMGAGLLRVIDAHVEGRPAPRRKGLFIAMERGWYYTAVMDSETGHFVEDLVIDDGPYALREEALYHGISTGYEWCAENNVVDDEVERTYRSYREAFDAARRQQ